MQELQDQLKVLLKEALKTKELSDANKNSAISGLDAVEDEELKSKLKGYNAQLSKLEKDGDIEGIHELVAQLNKSIYETK